MYTMKDKNLAVERELTYRRRVYPRLIASGKMTDGFAAAQIAVFEAILEDYAKAEQTERLI